jgi:hypothetical protein
MGTLSVGLVWIVAWPSATVTQSADSGYRRRAEVSTLDRSQPRMIPAMHTATEKYATTNNTLAMNGTLAMSGALRAPPSSPSMPIIALDARGSNVPSRRPAILLTVLVNRPGLNLMLVI